MRRLAEAWKTAIVLGCAALFVLAVPHPLGAPMPPVPQGKQACRLNLGSTVPRQPRPHECWEATASWYGGQFDGQPTASGATFNMYGITAAHRTLPLGSIVRVSNPETGRSLVVTINDRGPYVRGRGLDVSYGVARMLGFAQQGLCHVKIELLKLPAETWLPTHAKN
jgi:rare lipoprotein A (peptidoglycan hydrolase)